MLAEAVTWFWGKYGKEVTDRAAGSAKELWSRVQWSKKEQAYRERLMQHYSTTKLLGNPKDIRIDETYIDAYVFDQISAFQRVSIEKLRQESSRPSTAKGLAPQTDPEGALTRRRARRKNRSEDDASGLGAKRIPLRDLALKERRLYVLGKPGAGKSTFLRHITLLCCKGDIKKTPIFVPLKAWADSGLELIEFIEREFEICQFPKAKTFIAKLLESGEAIVLFDGLDEVNQEGDRRQKMIDVLTRFGRTYPASQIFVTCRIAATDYSFDKFKYVEVADFTEEQQDQFVAKWYSSTPERLKQFRAEWGRSDNEGLRQLARTPLLLALMCLAFDETLSFPRRRVELYQEALNALLKKWDSSRGIVRDSAYRKLSLVRKEQLLSHIAAETFRRSEFVIDKQTILRTIGQYLKALPPSDREEAGDADVVLQAMEVQHGILVERAFGIYSFSHLTFHEYFTARYLVDNANSGEVASSIRDHSHDDQWREVFLLVASVIDNGDRFLTDFLKALRQLIRGYPGIARLLLEVDRNSKDWGEGVGRPDFSHTETQPRKRTEAKRGGKLFVHVYLDALLGIAAELSQTGVTGRSPAMWRARYLAALLQSNPRRLGELVRDSNEELEILAAYFKSSHLFVECMNVAMATNRRIIEQQVLAPAA